MDIVDFDPGDGIVEYISSGGRDSFLSKFTDSGELIWALAWGGEDAGKWEDRALGLALDNNGNCYVAGMFEGTSDFYPGPGIDEHTSNGGTDAYLAKFPPDGNW